VTTRSATSWSGLISRATGCSRQSSGLTFPNFNAPPSELLQTNLIFPVPCDATEIGLAENVVRLAMHPADQFEAFRDLIDKGAGTADIDENGGGAGVRLRKG
jgi:hypothetical protein